MFPCDVGCSQLLLVQAVTATSDRSQDQVQPGPHHLQVLLHLAGHTTQVRKIIWALLEVPVVVLAQLQPLAQQANVGEEAELGRVQGRQGGLLG